MFEVVRLMLNDLLERLRRSVLDTLLDNVIEKEGENVAVSVPLGVDVMDLLPAEGVRVVDGVIVLLFVKDIDADRPAVSLDKVAVRLIPS